MTLLINIALACITIQCRSRVDRKRGQFNLALQTIVLYLYSCKTHKYSVYIK